MTVSLTRWDEDDYSSDCKIPTTGNDGVSVPTGQRLNIEGNKSKHAVVGTVDRIGKSAAC